MAAYMVQCGLIDFSQHLIAIVQLEYTHDTTSYML